MTNEKALDVYTKRMIAGGWRQSVWRRKSGPRSRDGDYARYDPVTERPTGYYIAVEGSIV